MNKKVVLLLLLILCISVIFVGCEEELPEGIENKKFYKDLGELHDLIIESIKQSKYAKDDIETILNKMNSSNHTNNLNDYELSILEGLNQQLPVLEEDLKYSSHVSSTTIEDMLWILNLHGDYALGDE